MALYLVGIGFIVAPIFYLFINRHMLKNRIEVDALVIKTKKLCGGDEGTFYYPVFQYNVKGEQFETEYMTGNARYSVGIVTRIYCYKHSPNIIILPDELIWHKIVPIIVVIVGIGIIVSRVFINMK